MSSGTVTSPFGPEAIETVEHLNDEHADTVAFIARAFAEVDIAALLPPAGAHISAFDHEAMEFTFDVNAETDMAGVTTRVPYATRAETVDDAFGHFYAILAAARDRRPDDALTSIEQEITPGIIPTWITEVSAVVDITPRIRQITVTGGLDGFVPKAPDQFVFVLAPPAGSDELTVDGSFSWSTYYATPEDERPMGAYYTIRRFDPTRQSLDLWVVLHGHAGSGERWARDVEVGSPVALWGPRDVYDPPAVCDRFVLLGDETALPAIAAILESLGSDSEAHVFVSLADGAEQVELASAARLEVTWLRDVVPNPLLAVVHDQRALLTPTTYVWGGAESRDITAVRKFVRSDVGLERDQVALSGYWRRTNR